MGASAVARRVVAGQALGAVVLLSLLATGCSSGPVAPSGSTPSTTPTDTSVAATDSAAARQVLEEADPTDPDSMAAIEALRFTGAGEQAARDIVVAYPSNGNVTWAAAWVYASSATDPAPLRPLLQHDDKSVRSMAAAGSIAMGDRAGFVILRDALADESQLRGSHPPRSLATFAFACVSRYVIAPGSPAPPENAEELPASKAAWAEWLGQHSAELQFDAASMTWSAP